MKDIFQDTRVIVGYFGERFEGIMNSHTFLTDISVENVRALIVKAYAKDAAITYEEPRDLKIGQINVFTKSIKVVVKNRSFYVFKYFHTLVINEENDYL